MFDLRHLNKISPPTKVHKIKLMRPFYGQCRRFVASQKNDCKYSDASSLWLSNVLTCPFHALLCYGRSPAAGQLFISKASWYAFVYLHSAYNCGFWKTGSEEFWSEIYHDRIITTSLSDMLGRFQSLESLHVIQADLKLLIKISSNTKKSSKTRLLITIIAR